MSKLTYWNDQGKHQTAYDELYQLLVPQSGPCDTIEGELLRASCKIYYDGMNNSFLNNTSGAVIFLQKHLPNQTDEVKRALTKLYYVSNTGGYSDVDEQVDNLELVANAVIEYLISRNGEYSKETLDMFQYQEDDCDDSQCRYCGEYYCRCGEHDEVE